MLNDPKKRKKLLKLLKKIIVKHKAKRKNKWYEKIFRGRNRKKKVKWYKRLRCFVKNMIKKIQSAEAENKNKKLSLTY